MDLKRYQRQIIVKEFGEEGQKILSKKNVVIIGAGGLGSNSANILVRLGIGHIEIFDDDIIDVTNLHRMSIYNEEDIGSSKSEILEGKLKLINSQININSYNEKITKNNIETLTKNADIIIDATDNFEARFLINELSIKKNVPWIYAGVQNTIGMILAIIPSKTPCFKCMSPNIADNITINKLPVMGNLPVTIASIQCTEALKVLLDQQPSGLIIYDTWNQLFEIVEIKRNLKCACCCKKSFEFL
jgi:adenylyltransferase/sulfurtransferase